MFKVNNKDTRTTEEYYRKNTKETLTLIKSIQVYNLI